MKRRQSIEQQISQKNSKACATSSPACRQGSPSSSAIASTPPQAASPALSFEVAGEPYYVEMVNDPLDPKLGAWFSTLSECTALYKDQENVVRAVVGLDCEWCPPWFRDNKPEHVDVIQLYSPFVDCLILCVSEWEELPPLLVNLLTDESIIKVGVNISGDASRIARDFNCAVRGLLNLDRGHRGPRATMEALCREVCPEEFHVDKDSVESKVRLSNWAAWPLTELQLKYASMDVVVSFAIFLFMQPQGSWQDRRVVELPALSSFTLEACAPLPSNRKTELQRAPSTGGVHSNFFLMHQNRSIVPPNINKKEYPKGSSNALQGLVIVVSGVLDSMSREDMTSYVEAHGGKVGKAITKGTTHLVNDHGVIGPSKLKKCEAQSVPVVGEDAIFEIVKKSLNK